MTTYASPAAFKQALEQRLRNDAAGDGEVMSRRRQLLVFDRFLARVAWSSARWRWTPLS